MAVDLRNPLSDSRRPIGLVAIALGACAGYYLGSLVGLQLRVSSATTSVLWPPNAVLTAVLVLTPPRRWMPILLCVLPVHLLIQLQVGWSPGFVTALFLTNCSEALLAATGLRLLSDIPWRFDTLRRLTIFFVAAVVVAPVLSSFLDAAVVMWFRGEPYWRVWQTRTLSNMLSELTVVPAVVGGVLSAVHWTRVRSARRFIEAGVLTLALVAVGWLQFGSPNGYLPLQTVSSRTPLAIQLPLILWAAVRFGPTGAGLTLLTTSLFTAWSVVHGVGPFASIEPVITVTALTLSLILVAATLMCLATLIEERRTTQHALKMRLQFEELLSRLSSALVHLPSDQLNRAFDAWLGRIAPVLGVDALTVFATSSRGEVLTPEYSWALPGLDAASSEVAELQQRWARRAIESREAFTMPERSGRDLSAGGAVPLVGEGQVFGVLAFGSIGDRPPEDLAANALLLGEVLASALSRKESEDALRASEVMKSAILQSLTSGVAVLDRDGLLLQFNERWRDSVRALGRYEGTIGEELLDSCRAGLPSGDATAESLRLSAMAGVSAVLAGTRDRFTIDQKAATGDGGWWSLTVMPLNRPEGGAVLVLDDRTELRRAEMDAQRTRLQLAHVGRVSMVGEMTASLAHQLNQPLTAIMTNAHAARRIMSAAQPNYDEVRTILADIVADDRRASDVIQRLRDFLRKGELQMARLSVSDVVREVVDLLNSEAIIRNITLSVELTTDGHFVRGDRVQMQQVVLNLLHNAMEAVGDRQDGPRQVSVECRPLDSAHVLLSVSDSGDGLPAGAEDLVFEPFYSTKPLGMGLGLSIVRSIVEAHGGSIHATVNELRGATFEVTLPRLP